MFSLRFSSLVICIGTLALAGASSAQIEPVSQFLHGQADASLTWTGPFPPSIASSTQSMNTFGLINAVAIAENFDDLVVSAEARALGQLSARSNGYTLASGGIARGWTDLAALADASFSSEAIFVFNVTRAVEVSLITTFLYGMTPDGNGSLQSSVQLFGPASTTIYDHTHVTPNSYTETIPLLLTPGQYTLITSAMGTINHVPGELARVSSFGIAELVVVPSPGALSICAIACAMCRRRRR